MLIKTGHLKSSTWKTNMSIDTSENQSSNSSAKDVSSHLSSLIDARLTRRGVLGGLAGAYGLAVAACQSQSETDVDGPFDSAFNFKEISRGMDETHHISDGHQADILLRWGDPLFDDSPEFDPYAQTAEAQRKQFGYNNDFVGFYPSVGGAGASLRKPWIYIYKSYAAGIRWE